MARPWVTERRLVVKPNIATRGASAWIISAAALDSLPWMRPPRCETRLIASPRNSLGQVMSTFITGSSITGPAARQAESKAMLAQASKAKVDGGELVVLYADQGDPDVDGRVAELDARAEGRLKPRSTASNISSGTWGARSRFE